MKDKIIEILKQYVDFSAYDRGGTSEVLYNKLAADLNAAFEERLREELIKYTDRNFTSIVGDGTIFVDLYMNLNPEEVDAEATKDCYPKEYTHWLFQGCPFLIGENAIGRIIAYRVKDGRSMNLDELFDYWKNLKK